MERIELGDRIFLAAEAIEGMEMICEFFAGGEFATCLGSELEDERYSTGDYGILGYICPKCGAKVYLDDYFYEEEQEQITEQCPECGFSFGI